MSRNRKLTECQMADFADDYAERERLRRIVSENARIVVAMELGVSAGTIQKVEKGQKVPRVAPAKVTEVIRRRALYRLCLELYRSDYSDRVLMARYDISKPTLLRRAQEYRAAQMESRRMAA